MTLPRMHLLACSRHGEFAVTGINMPLGLMPVQPMARICICSSIGRACPQIVVIQSHARRPRSLPCCQASMRLWLRHTEPVGQLVGLAGCV
jgi:hypothetical protein